MFETFIHHIKKFFFPPADILTINKLLASSCAPIYTAVGVLSGNSTKAQVELMTLNVARDNKMSGVTITMS